MKPGKLSQRARLTWHCKEPGWYVSSPMNGPTIERCGSLPHPWHVYYSDALRPDTQERTLALAKRAAEELHRRAERARRLRLRPLVTRKRQTRQ